MVEHGRARMAVAGLDVEWLEADAEALPFADGAFDRVVSCFGAIFAPRPATAAAELFRVARAGGTVGLANWEPESFPGRTHATVASFMPPRSRRRSRCSPTGASRRASATAWRRTPPTCGSRAAWS